MQLENGVWAWDISLSKYTRETFKNCKNYSKHLPPKYRLQTFGPNPFLTQYKLGIDIGPELDPDIALYFQSLIGITCTGWLSRSHRHSKQKSHCYHHTWHFHLKVTWMLLCTSWHNFGHHNLLFMDPSNIEDDQFQVMDWKEFYGKVTTPPQKMPILL